jgi:hypothetical protein
VLEGVGSDRLYGAYGSVRTETGFSTVSSLSRHRLARESERPVNSEPSVARQASTLQTVARHHPNQCSINQFIYVCCILPTISRVLVRNRQTPQHDIYPVDAEVRRGLDPPCLKASRLRDQEASMAAVAASEEEARPIRLSPVIQAVIQE